MINNDLKKIALADFGSAKVIGDENYNRLPALTPDYCAPELNYNSTENVSDKTDIYSFGMLFFK